MEFNGYGEELQYLIDMVESEESNNWNKANYDLDANMHPDSLRKSFNVGRYCGYNVAKYYQNKIESDILSDEEFLRLQKLKDEIYKEKCKLQDANREKRKYLREESRLETMLEHMKECVLELEPINFKKTTYSYGTNLEAVLMVSDLHNEAKVDNVYNYYDREVLIERLGQLKDKTISICKKEKVDYLNVELLGDFITGVIHGSTIAQAQDDVIEQVIGVSEILANFINELYKEIPNIKVYSVFGNHGRTSKGKSDRANKENFERLVPEFLKLRLPHIKVIDSKYEDHLVYKLRDGRLIVNTHGQYDAPNNAMSHFLELLKTDIFEIHMAHYHDYYESNGVVVNGSIIGSDDYAISLRKNAKATQILRVYGKDVSCYKLILD